MITFIALYGSCIHVGMCTTITIMILTMYTVFTQPLARNNILSNYISTHMYSSAGRLALIGQITCIDHQLKLCVIQFIDTKPVLNKLSRLITLSFLDEDFLAEHYDDIVLPDGAKELLQHHGRFTRSTLESCVEFSESIPLQFFVDILEHVKIVAAIDQTSEYFMPCALPYATEMPDSSHPWVIRLRVRRGVDEEYVPIPVGYLPAILVFLLTMFSGLFFLNRRQWQYRNVIKLCYKPGGVVCLVERHLQLEVHYSGYDHERLQQECAIIRNNVLESMRLTEKKLHIREGAMTKVDSFICSCGEGRAHHICAYNPETHIVECEMTRKVFVLEPQHQLWLGV